LQKPKTDSINYQVLEHGLRLMYRTRRNGSEGCDVDQLVPFTQSATAFGAVGGSGFFAPTAIGDGASFAAAPSTDGATRTYDSINRRPTDIRFIRPR
jgi:hypothetical protein